MQSLDVSIAPVSEADFEQLADLRVAAMQESLEHVGRFDRERARMRLRNTFAPEHTRSIHFEGEMVGFYAARPSPVGFYLDHLYIHPRFQNRGLGGFVIRRIIDEAETMCVPILVGALKESASNRFYLRHGFVKTGESEWDTYYTRPTSKNVPRS